MVTLERTRPGRWSRTCSRVAAMSISFTPGDGVGHRLLRGVPRGQDSESLGIQAWRCENLLLHAVPGPWAWRRLQQGPGVESTVLTFCHAVQYHVNEDVGAGPPCTITETGVGDRLSLGASRRGWYGGDKCLRWEQHWVESWGGCE
jgi:hypothetical protein